MKKLQTCTTLVLDPGLEDEQWKIFVKLVNTFDANGNVQSDEITSLRISICTHEPKESSTVLTFSEMLSWKDVLEFLPKIEPDYV